MYIAADLADWLEQEMQKSDDLIYGNQEKARKKDIEAFVDAHPNFFAAAVVWDLADDVNNAVTSLSNGRAMRNFGTSFIIDIGRLGTGFGEGTAGGIFQDVLRVIGIVPWGKVSGLVAPRLLSFAGPMASRAKQFYWGAIRGKQCGPISVGKALEQTGTKLFITLDDVAAAMKRDLSTFKGLKGVGTTIDETRQALVQLKAAFNELKDVSKAGIQNWDDIMSLARNTDGVLLVTVKRTVDGVHKAHQFMVSNTGKGVKIFDRAGVFNSLDDLSRHYGAANPSQYYKINVNNPIFQVKNWAMDEALISRLNAAGPLGMVVVKGVEMIIGFNPNVGSEKVEEKFRDFMSTRQPDPAMPVQPVAQLPLKHIHKVVGPRVERRDWLSSIAEKWYGDMLLWPILFDYNRDGAFTNPNKIVVGQTIKIPDIAAKTPAQLNEYRTRGRNWRQAAV